MGHDYIESFIANPNLIVLAYLAKVQCVSTATCKRAFSIQILIKMSVRNSLGNKNLERMLRIASREPDDNFNNIIEEAIPLWKKETKNRFLYTKLLTFHSLCFLVQLCFPILRMLIS